MKTTNNQLRPEITNNPPSHVKMSNKEILDKISSQIQGCGIKKIEYAYCSDYVSVEDLYAKKEINKPYYMMIHIDDDHVIRLWIDPRYDTKTGKMTSIGFSTNLLDSKYQGAFFGNLNEKKIVDGLVQDIKRRCKQVQDMKNSQSINEKIANKAIKAIKEAMPEAQITHQDIVSLKEPITKERIINISVNGHIYSFKPRASNICNGCNQQYFDVESMDPRDHTNSLCTKKSSFLCKCITIGNEDKFIKKLVKGIQCEERINNLRTQLVPLITMHYQYHTPTTEQLVKEYQTKLNDAKQLRQSYEINDDKRKQILEYIRENARQRQTEKAKQRQNLYNNIPINNIKQASNNQQPPRNSSNNHPLDTFFEQNSFTY